MQSKRLKLVASLALVLASMSYTGVASASASPTSFAAQAKPSFTLPLGILDLSIGGPGLQVGANLFPKATYTPILDVSLLKGAVSVSAAVGTSPVPEPESLVMMGVGLALVSFVVRRRRNNLS